MKKHQYCQQSGNLLQRPAHWLPCLILSLCLLGISFPALSQSDEPAPLLIYLAGSGRAALDRQVTDLLQQELGERLTIRSFEPGRTSQDQDTPVITIGSEALTTVRQESRKVPIISLLASPSLLRTYASQPPASNVTGIYRGAPLLRQALAGKVILPHSTRVAMLATPESAVLYEQLQEQLQNYGMEGRTFIVTDRNNLIRTLIRALNYGDFLLAAPDSDIYNPRTIKHILLTAYRRNRIVIGPAQAYVTAGSLASVYAPLDAMVSEAADFILTLEQQGELREPVYPDIFDISVNRQVAQSLNIPVPDDDQIVEDVRKFAGPSGESSDE